MPRLLHIPASYYGVTTPLLLALWSDLWPNLLRLDRYISHGNDFLWGVDLVRLNFVANWLIVFSFLVIFLTFVFLIFKGRRNMARPWLFVAIGAFILASLERVFHVEAVKPTYRLALLTALSFLIVAPLPLQLHLGHPERSPEMYFTPHSTSAMAMFGYVYLWYLMAVLVFEIWLVFFGVVAKNAVDIGPIPLIV